MSLIDESNVSLIQLKVTDLSFDDALIAELKIHLEKSLEMNLRNVVLDVASVNLFSSATIGTILFFHRKLSPRAHWIKLRNARPGLVKQFQMMGLGILIEETKAG